MKYSIKWIVFKIRYTNFLNANFNAFINDWENYENAFINSDKENQIKKIFNNAITKYENDIIEIYKDEQLVSEYKEKFKFYTKLLRYDYYFIYNNI